MLGLFLILAFSSSIYIWTRYSNLNDFFLGKLLARTGKNAGRKVLLLTAHPDDEVMFFTPSIRAFLAAGYSVRVVCFSTGDFDGKGKVRTKELYSCLSLLGIPSSNVECLDLPNLFPDDSSRLWKEQDIVSKIDTFCKKYTPDILLSFDSRGVSGHLNHRSLYHGLVSFLKTTNVPTIVGYTLSTVSPLRKFSSFVDIFLTFVPVMYSYLTGVDSDDLVFVSSLSDFNLAQTVFCFHQCNTQAMKLHKSQMVWFRHLYIWFSRYMIVNDLKVVEENF